jgi:hypothetical protein
MIKALSSEGLTTIITTLASSNYGLAAFGNCGGVFFASLACSRACSRAASGSLMPHL